MGVLIRYPDCSVEASTQEKKYTIEMVDMNIVMLSAKNQDNMTPRDWANGIREIAVKNKIVSITSVSSDMGNGPSPYNQTTAIIVIVEPKRI
ncbi:MAG: hypothetical protein PHG83_02605 [Patescibacteria group bacterium]|nr:hypothetical protein [Patescibacteria group bacterium]